MVDNNDEYLNDNIMINYDSKRFSLENCLNSHRNPSDIEFHSNTKRRKFQFIFSLDFCFVFLNVFNLNHF